MKLFTKRVLIEIKSSSFSITLFGRKGRVVENRIDLQDVQSYSIQFPVENINDIRLKLRNGATYFYSFPTKKQNDGDSEGREVVNRFHSAIKKYNDGPTNKIALLPSFYASKAGLIVIVSLSLFLSFSVVLIAATKGASSLPFSFIFSALLIIQLISKRSRELSSYNKMKHSENL